jgi:tetraacyldisaccharide 4'-kinase
MYIRPDSIFDKIKIFLLNAVSILYKSISFLNLTLKGLRPKKFPAYIVSVDNLAFGGTGKTPLVMRLAKELLAMEFEVAIVSRGYRSQFEREGVQVTLRHSAAEAGDEAVLLKHSVPGAGVFIGGDRKRSIEAAVREGFRFIVLDDGFQSTDIVRDFSIMLLKASHPYYYLRNFLRCSGRENLILNLRETGSQEPGTGQYWFVTDGFFDSSGRRVDIGDSGIAGFSALGDNSRFQRDLEALNCLGFRGFPDHHPYTKEDIETLDRFRQNLHAEYLVCTEKDFVKIRHIPIAKIPLIFVKNSIKLDVDLMGQILDDAKAKGFD